ncbi:Ww domain-containing oxidoreductase, partial [Globisporangium splendens]
MGASSSHDAAPWDGSQIPSLSGKVAIVTGGNSGVGFEAAKKLAERNAIVVLACRSEERGREAQQSILQHVQQQRSTLSGSEREALAPPQVEFMRLDVGSLASVAAFATQFRESFHRLDLLINNAGVGVVYNQVTEDGFEASFGINHLGHFYLTKLLFDLLEKAPSARVVNVSSLAHRRATIKFDEQGQLSMKTGYGVSKLANLLFTYELERRLRANGIRNVISVAAHPGISNTGIFAKSIYVSAPKILQWILVKLTALLPLQSAEMGALPTLYAATAENVQGMEYYGPARLGRWGYPVREISSVESYNEDKGKKLWTLSEQLTKCKFEF